MKSERPIDYRSSSAAKPRGGFSSYLQEYGSRVLLFVVLATLAYMVASRWFTGRSEKMSQAGMDLGNALYALDQIRDMQNAPPERLAMIRKEYAGEVEQAVRDLLDVSTDPHLRAQALVARGDLNWLLANYPELPGATTRPELGVGKSREELLSAAESAYKQVLQPPQNQDAQSVITARFSLAAIAQDRAQWDQAREYYQQIDNDPAAGSGFKKLAELDLESLKKIEKPAYLAGPLAPPVLGPMPPIDLPETTHPSASAPAASGPSATSPAATSPAGGPPIGPAAPSSAPAATSPSPGGAAR